MAQDNFLDIRFPEDISISSAGGPEFFTTINTNRYKGEFRNINWQSPRRRYKIGYDLKNPSQINHLIAFFNICKGRAIAFRYKDWLDYTANNATIGTGDGTTKSFQLKKTYSYQTIEMGRIITKPVQNTVNISINATLVEKAKFTVNHLTGIVTFTNAPLESEVISATFEFDTPARFENDFLSISKDGAQSYNAHDISLVETNS